MICLLPVEMYPSTMAQKETRNINMVIILLVLMGSFGANICCSRNNEVEHFEKAKVRIDPRLKLNDDFLGISQKPNQHQGNI